MATNAKLIIDANALALALSITIETDGLNNAQLTALVSDLRAKKTDAETVTQADTAEAEAEVEAEAEAEVEAEVEAETYHVMPGKALTTKRGILADFDPISAADLAGGADALAVFVKSGHIGQT